MKRWNMHQLQFIHVRSIISEGTATAYNCYIFEIKLILARIHMFVDSYSENQLKYAFKYKFTSILFEVIHFMIYIFSKESTNVTKLVKIKSSNSSVD